MFRRLSTVAYQYIPRTAFALALSTLLVSTFLPANADTKFSSKLWKEAPLSKSNDWSRQDQMSAFCKENKVNGMDRAKVIEALGQPDLVTVSAPKGEYEATIDFYRISAKNKQCFRIDYDKNGKAKTNMLEAGPCRANMDIGPGVRVLNQTQLDKFLTTKMSTNEGRNLTRSQVLRELGTSERNEADNVMVGGRYWKHVTDVWRLTKDGNKQFMIQFDDESTSDGSNIDQTRVRNYWVRTIGVNCPRTKKTE